MAGAEGAGFDGGTDGIRTWDYVCAAGGRWDAGWASTHLHGVCYNWLQIALLPPSIRKGHEQAAEKLAGAGRGLLQGLQL